LEALTIMFRDLIMGENILRQKNKPSFTYKIRYFCKSCWVYIDANPSRKTPYEIRIEELNETVSDSKSIITDLNNVPGEKISLAKLTDETNGFLPKFVFGYYSGQSDRMERVFQKYLASYDKDLRAGKNPGLKRLFYAQPVHSNFVLLSFIINEAELTNRFLQEQLGLEEGGVDSVLFVLRQPSWKSKEGDPRFWNARGVVADFLAKLYEISLAPIRITRKEPVSLWNKKTLEFLYLYVKDLDALKEPSMECGLP